VARCARRHGWSQSERNIGKAEWHIVRFARSEMHSCVDAQPRSAELTYFLSHWPEGATQPACRCAPSTLPLRPDWDSLHAVAGDCQETVMLPGPELWPVTEKRFSFRLARRQFARLCTTSEEQSCNSTSPRKCTIALFVHFVICILWCLCTLAVSSSKYI
jgi:hypothetical protein